MAQETQGARIVDDVYPSPYQTDVAPSRLVFSMHEPLRALARALARPAPTIAASRRAAVAIILRVVGAPDCDFPQTAAPTLADFLASPASAAPASRVEALFIRRAVRATDPWSGHVALPGGKREAGDADDAATAAREAAEEVGVDVRALLRVGALGDRHATAGGATLDVAFAVVVWVAPDARALPLTLQPGEVAAARWVPLSALSASRTRYALAKPAVRYLCGAAAAARVPPWLAAAARLDALFLPSIELVGAAPAVAPGAPAADDGGRFELWGMTLRAAADLVAAAGGERLNWPFARLRWPWHGALLLSLLAFDAGGAAWAWRRALALGGTTLIALAALRTLG